MAYHRRGHVYCRGCGIQGASLQIIHHYLWDELPIEDVPFQCRECNAQFHHRRAATWHMETEHGYHKPITEAFTGTLRDLPVYQMVEDRLRPQWTQPRLGNERRYQRRQRPRPGRGRRPTARGRRPMAPQASKSQAQEQAHHQDEGLVELPMETQERYDEIMLGAEQPADNAPTGVNNQEMSGQDISESEDEESITCSKQEESDSDSGSQNSTSWKRARQPPQDHSEQRAAEGETSMANVTSTAGPSNQTAESDDQVSDAITDVIPVLQRLTKQLERATQEWSDLSKVYQDMIRILQENIRVLEKNNEFHRYWLLLDRGKHHGAAHMLSQSQLSQTTDGRSGLQRVDAPNIGGQETLV